MLAIGIRDPVIALAVYHARNRPPNLLQRAPECRSLSDGLQWLNQRNALKNAFSSVIDSVEHP